MNRPSTPPYRTSFCSAGDLSRINGLNRNTLLGWINRYDHEMRNVGVLPVAKGATRFFNMEQIGLFATVRAGLWMRQAEGVLDSLPQIAEHAAELYETLIAECRWEEEGASQRPYLPRSEQPWHLEGKLYFGSSVLFRPTHRPYYDGGESLADLNGFPIPSILIPLDATLRNAWTRALYVFNELALPVE